MIERHGWTLLFHECLIAQFRKLANATNAAKRRDPDGFEGNANVKLFNALSHLMLEVVPSDPNRDEYRQGDTMAPEFRHWRRAKVGRRFRLFFRFDSRSKIIIFTWVNDETRLRSAWTRQKDTGSTSSSGRARKGQYIGTMPYPEHLIAIMREELTSNGVEEARSAEAVDAALAPGSGTVLVVVNSVCGCAAGKARPGVVHALQTAEVKPHKAITVFAGADIEAVDRVRERMVGLPPSSPCFALFRDGEPVYMMHRFQIEGRNAQAISADLVNAFAETVQ